MDRSLIQRKQIAQTGDLSRRRDNLLHLYNNFEEVVGSFVAFRDRFPVFRIRQRLLSLDRILKVG